MEAKLVQAGANKVYNKLDKVVPYQPIDARGIPQSRRSDAIGKGFMATTMVGIPTAMGATTINKWQQGQAKANKKP